MLERLIVHIGPPKTGTKSIQRGLNENREFCANRGLIYPEGPWHGQLASWALDGEPNSTFNRWTKRTNQAANTEADHKYVAKLKTELTNTTYRYGFLSFEGFSDLPHTAWVKVKNLLIDCAQEISILVYCRHPHSLGPSVLGGHTLNGFVCPPAKMIRLYKPILSPIVEVFGKENVILREFMKESFYHGDVFSDAVAQLDKDLADDLHRQGVGRKIHNEGLSYEAFQIAEHMREQLDRSANNAHRLRYIRTLLAIRGEKFKLSEQQANDVTRLAAQHINYLKSTFDFEFTEPEQTRYRAPGAGLSPDTAKSIAAALVFAVEKKWPANTQWMRKHGQ